MSEEKDKDIKQRVSELTTINFSITKCPEKVFQRFTDFCRKETGNNYSFGLKLLLDGMEGNIKEALIFEQYIELKAEIEDIKASLAETKPEKKKKDKTFGVK
jgi:hypothetical protein